MISKELYILCDSNTESLAVGLGLNCIKRIVIPAGEENKNIENVQKIWKALEEGHASREATLMNVGGGMITDLGGFAASTFKRGIHFINVPTTLLAMVDAGFGGKTAINFGGVKNLVGTFAEPDEVWIKPEMLRSLDGRNIRAGWAEMVKHGLIDSENLYKETMGVDLVKIDKETIERSAEVKRRIVAEDPREKGLRKILNLGHTAGHAFEAAGEGRLLHGEAVAYGLVVAIYLSVVKLRFDKSILTEMRHWIVENYGMLPFDCKSYDRLWEAMMNDKKNGENGKVMMVLLHEIGKAEWGIEVTKDEMFEAIDFLR